MLQELEHKGNGNAGMAGLELVGCDGFRTLTPFLLLAVTLLGGILFQHFCLWSHRKDP